MSYSFIKIYHAGRRFSGIFAEMKQRLILFIFIISFLLFFNAGSRAQCSICAKTTQQMGEKPAKGFNSGIVYLMLTPFAIMGVVGYRWWKSNRS